MRKSNRSKNQPQSSRFSRNSMSFLVFFGLFAVVLGFNAFEKHETEKSLELFAEGKNLAGKGFSKDAEDKFLKALELNPDLTEALVSLGNIAASSEKFNIALPYYQKAFDQDSTNFPAIIGQAVSLDGIGNFVSAEAAYQKAIFVKSDFSEIYYNLGFLYQRQRLYKEAVKQYEKALELKPMFLQAQANLGLCWDRLHDPGKAIIVYRRAIALNLKEGPLYTRLGSSLMKLYRYDQAYSAFKKAIELGESRSSIYVHLGEIAEEKGNIEESISNYNKALSIEKKSSEIFEKLAGVLVQKEKKSLAEQYYKKAIEIDSQNSNARYGLAQLYMERGELSKAEEELDDFQRLKEFEGRKKTLLRAVERQPRNPEPAFLLAKFYIEFDRKKEAKEILERISLVSPEFSKAQATLKQIAKTN